MQIENFNDLINIAKTRTIKKLVVAAAEDVTVIEAVNKALLLGIIHPILIGDKEKIEEIGKKLKIELSHFEIHHCIDQTEASYLASKFIRDKKADILMKGLVKTGIFLKPVVNKESNLQNGHLSHLAIFKSPYYHKLLGITDAAVNIAPDFNEKIMIINNAVQAFHKIGISNPKVAVIAAVETVNPKIEATVHAAMLTQMNKRNQITGCIIDGPFAVDNATSKDAAEHKHIESEVAGNADILLAPDLNCGNILYKSLNFLGGAICAAVVLGANVPIVLTSRADSVESKYLSVALATVIS